LLSSGKGVLWFAPALLMAPAGGRAALARSPGTDAGRDALRATARGVAWGALAACALALFLYSRFEHWAGDGSFGPRYLVPLLPLAFLLVALALEHAGRARRGLAWALGLLGLAVQLAGVSIYFGAQMREAGDYPYRLPLEHPQFMSESHFNPAYSP